MSKLIYPIMPEFSRTFVIMLNTKEIKDSVVALYSQKRNVAGIY